MTSVLIIQGKQCAVPGCEKPFHAKTMCRPHYMRARIHGSPYGGATPRGNIIGSPQRYMSEVVLPFSNTVSCLFWPFSRSSHGYGGYYHAGKQTTPARAVCIMTQGDPKGDRNEAAHSCGNGHLGCVSPHHIRWATHAENFADKIVHGTHLHGERSPAAKLTDLAVQEIKSRYAKHKTTQRELAREYGVSQSAISLIVSGRNWAQ